MTQSRPMLDFYFDFISPFGYLASLEVDGVATRHGWECRWNSMLVGVSVLKVMGMKALPEIPLKGAYLQREIARHCRRHGISLGRSTSAAPVNPVPAGRAFHWIAKNYTAELKPFARAILDAYWLEGKDISQISLLVEHFVRLIGDGPAFAAALTGGEGDVLLRKAVANSLDRGVFGSPFFLAAGEPFFGLDKMGQIDEWLGCGGW